MAGRLILHVGYPKTGTSTLQRAFDGERDHILARYGLLYPESCVARPEHGHHDLAWEITGNALFDPSRGGRAELVEEVRRIDPTDVLLSSEAFVDTLVDHSEAVDRLIAGFDRFDPVIVVAVRRIDEYLEALYVTQLGAWTWGRPIRRSLDIPEYLEQRDVDRVLEPLRILRDSPYRVIHLPYGPDMVGRFGAALGLPPALEQTLRTHGDANPTTMSPRAMGLIVHLARHPDEAALRTEVARRRDEFHGVLMDLGPRGRTRLVAPEAARALIARAEPAYREVGDAFATEVIGDGAGGEWETAEPRLEIDDAEVDRVNGFFGRVVIG